MLVAFALVWTADAAFAKILPVRSIEVTTAQPTVGHRVNVLVRFGPDFKLGDAPWENFEVSVLPMRRTDASGWPLGLSDRGTAVPLRRVSQGVFRGTFVIREPGQYAVFAWSSVYAREDRSRGVVTKAPFAAPVRLRIGRDASAATDRAPFSPLPVWFAASALAIGTGAALTVRRLRSRRRVLATSPARR